MNMKAVSAITLAAVSLGLSLSARAQDAAAVGQMVPAQVSLKSTIDAKKAQPGSTFQTTLVSKVHLANGTDLPAGTVLVGTIGTDDMQMTGDTKLAIRFTTANLKNGQSIPVKATIVQFTKADDVTGGGYVATAGQTAGWDSNLKVDQKSVSNGVDFHSAASSTNSGVFVASKGKDVTLRTGSEFALAIAAQPGANTTTTGH